MTTQDKKLTPSEKLKEIEDMHYPSSENIVSVGVKYPDIKWLISRVKQLEQVCSDIAFQLRKNSGYKYEQEQELIEAITTMPEE